MKNRIRDIDRLSDIIEQCNFIQRNTSLSEDEFYRDDVLKLAILKSLEIIGEATTQMSKKTKEDFAEIVWQDMIRARNFYIHEYFKIQWPLVWLSVKKEIDFEKISNYCEHIKLQLTIELL